MKIETITQTIEFTIEEKHSITVCRKRKIVSRAGDRAEAGRVSKIEERNGETQRSRRESDEEKSR